eukprot:1492861-Amphidinium_carterae.1
MGLRQEVNVMCSTQVFVSGLSGKTLAEKSRSGQPDGVQPGDWEVFEQQVVQYSGTLSGNDIVRIFNHIVPYARAFLTLHFIFKRWSTPRRGIEHIEQWSLSIFWARGVEHIERIERDNRVGLNRLNGLIVTSVLHGAHYILGCEPSLVQHSEVKNPPHVQRENSTLEDKSF